MSKEYTNEEIFNGICIAIQNCLNKTITINKTDRLVEDLEFDSLRIATLTFCIESELNCTITLNEWIAAAHDSGDLTVNSLVNYVAENMQSLEAA